MKAIESEQAENAQAHSFLIQNRQFLRVFQLIAPVCSSFCSLGVGDGVRAISRRIPVLSLPFLYVKGLAEVTVSPS